jgi:hypothetical protein
MWPDSGLQLLRHLRQDVLEGLDADLLFVGVQDLHEAGHVGALEVVRQVDVHVEGGDGVLLAVAAVLDPHRVADVLDADLVDGDMPDVLAALHVGDVALGGCCFGHRISSAVVPAPPAYAAACLGQGTGTPAGGKPRPAGESGEKKRGIIAACETPCNPRPIH